MELDLIYMNANKEDIGVMDDYKLDLAFGKDENNFECTIIKSQHCCEKDYYLYIENTEYGGIIDGIGVDNEEVLYTGRTWHGILNSKIIEPDNDYLICNGEATDVLSMLIDRIGLNSLFKAVNSDTAITITNYKMNRYIKGYDGIVKMLKTVNAKLIMKFNNGFVELSAEPIVDYSKDEQFDTDTIELSVKKKYNNVNHVICLGKGNLSDREVIHIYADENGNITENQALTGLDEVTAVYENVNAEGYELKQGGIDLLKNSWNADEINFDFSAEDRNYDIGDIVGAGEHITGTEATREIEKKIVTIRNNTVTVSYPSITIGSKSVAVSGGTGGGSNPELEADVRELQQQMADLLYDEIDITSFTNTAGKQEKGATVTAVTLNWKVNKTPTALILDGKSIDTSLTSETLPGLNIKSNRTFTLVATDERGATDTATTTISFYNGVYYGVISALAEINNSLVLSLKKELQSGRALNFTETAGAGQKIAYAIPKSYGTPNFNVGGFDGGFSLVKTFAFTNSSGYTETYCVWISDNAGLGNTTVKVT